MAQQTPAYPVQFDVDYPDRPLNRLTTFFRIIVAVPILIVIGLLASSEASYGPNGETYAWGAGVGILSAATLLMILFREKYPRWWFDWNVNLLKFENRIAAYLFLLRDEYPSTDEEQAVHLDLPYPNVANDLNRWLPLIKWFLAIPHYIVLFFLWIGAIIAIIIAWFAILFTGRYPRGLFRYVVNVMRWTLRVIAYAFVLSTDRYPPFRLGP